MEGPANRSLHKNSIMNPFIVPTTIRTRRACPVKRAKADLHRERNRRPKAAAAPSASNTLDGSGTGLVGIPGTLSLI